jgi:hypothetical protein
MPKRWNRSSLAREAYSMKRIVLVTVLSVGFLLVRSRLTESISGPRFWVAFISQKIARWHRRALPRRLHLVLTSFL